MEIKYQKFTDESYTSFVRQFVSLLDEQLKLWEESPKDNQSFRDLIERMPAIISLVNTVGYLRGQDNVFLNVRPHTKDQNEYYSYEDQFESRLRTLIELISDSQFKQQYTDKLESYFVKTRT